MAEHSEDNAVTSGDSSEGIGVPPEVGSGSSASSAQLRTTSGRVGIADGRLRPVLLDIEASGRISLCPECARKLFPTFSPSDEIQLFLIKRQSGSNVENSEPVTSVTRRLSLPNNRRKESGYQSFYCPLCNNRQSYTEETEDPSSRSDCRNSHIEQRQEIDHLKGRVKELEDIVYQLTAKNSQGNPADMTSDEDEITSS